MLFDNNEEYLDDWILDSSSEQQYIHSDKEQ